MCPCAGWHRVGQWAARGPSSSSSLRSGPTTVFSDSQSALAMIVNPTNARSKHIDIKYHFVRGCVSSQNMRFKYVPTTEQQADLLTKSLPTVTHLKFTDLLFGIAHFACVAVNGAPL